eukprot:6209966-Pleurochrysis_carterae.AAC.1
MCRHVSRCASLPCFVFRQSRVRSKALQILACMVVFTDKPLVCAPRALAGHGGWVAAPRRALALECNAPGIQESRTVGRQSFGRERFRGMGNVL